MKNILLVIVAMFAFSCVAFAQDFKTPVLPNQFGFFGIFNRSDAVEPKNAGGAGFTIARNFDIAGAKVLFQNEFMGYSDQAFNDVTGGHVYRNEFSVRVPTDITYNFAGNPSQVYVGGQAATDHQSGVTTFQPSALVGFKTAGVSNTTLVEYHYVFPTGNVNIQGHQVKVRFYRPLESNPRYTVVTGFDGFTGKFNPVPVSQEDLYSVKIVAGISIK